MSYREQVSQWEQMVSSSLPHLSRPQAKVLALWSMTMIVVGSCGTTLVGAWLSCTVGGSEESWRQRLREWCYDARDKKGAQRSEVVVCSCFRPLLRWVLSWWADAGKQGQQQLALAMDASTLSDRFTVLCISVLYRGCAIPVAWAIVPAWGKGAWKPIWLDLFDLLAESVPSDWTVLVLADRGLYARWLYQHLQRLGWHPYLRINQGGKARPLGMDSYHWLATFAPVPGYWWSGQVRCFTETSSRLDCTLVVCWDEVHEERWFIVTDLLPAQADIAWYAMRAWIECGFKDTKRGGWNWHHTKMTDPRRAERHWLVMAVATLWVISVGGEVDANLPQSSFETLPPTHIARRLSKQRARQRRISCFARGILTICAALVTEDPLPMGQLLAFSWPSSPPEISVGASELGGTQKPYP
jgi:Transposase DDE domain